MNMRFFPACLAGFGEGFLLGSHCRNEAASINSDFFFIFVLSAQLIAVFNLLIRIPLDEKIGLLVGFWFGICFAFEKNVVEESVDCRHARIM